MSPRLTGTTLQNRGQSAPRLRDRVGPRTVTTGEVPAATRVRLLRAKQLQCGAAKASGALPSPPAPQRAPQPPPSPRDEAARALFGEERVSLSRCRDDGDDTPSESFTADRAPTRPATPSKPSTPVEMPAVCRWLSTLATPYVDREGARHVVTPIESRVRAQGAASRPATGTRTATNAAHQRDVAGEDAGGEGSVAPSSAAAQRVVRAHAMVMFEAEMLGALRVAKDAPAEDKAFADAVQYMFNEGVAASRRDEALRVRTRRQVILREHLESLRQRRRGADLRAAEAQGVVAPEALFAGDAGAGSWCDARPAADETAMNIFRRLSARRKVNMEQPYFPKPFYLPPGEDDVDGFGL